MVYRVSLVPKTKLSYGVMSNGYLRSRWLRLIGFLPRRAALHLTRTRSPSSSMNRLATAPIYKRRMCSGHFH